MPRFLRSLAPATTDAARYGEVSPGNEWAVPGGFAYGDAEPSPDAGALRKAFECCFLAVDSFTHAAMVEVAEIDPAELDEIKLRLAFQMVHRLGAPGLGAALPVAQQEIEYTASLCELPVGTRLVMARTTRDGDIHEEIRRVIEGQAQDGGSPIDHSGVRIFGVVDDDG